MPQVMEQPTDFAPPSLLVQFTREDCAQFLEEGRLQNGRYELIEGLIIRKMGQNRPHSACIGRLNAWCIQIFSGDFVQSQATINVSPVDNPTSEPEPDVFVLNRSIDHFVSEFPGPDDLALVVEVSDSTLAFDLSTKAALYARAGIVEYWVVDVSGRAITIHRAPLDARYTSVVRYAADEFVTTLSRPDARVLVSALMPPLGVAEETR